MTYQAPVPSRVPYDVDDGQNRTIMMTYLVFAHNVDGLNRTIMTYMVPAHNVDDGQDRTKIMTYLIHAHNVDDGKDRTTMMMYLIKTTTLRNT